MRAPRTTDAITTTNRFIAVLPSLGISLVQKVGVAENREYQVSTRLGGRGSPVAGVGFDPTTFGLGGDYLPGRRPLDLEREAGVGAAKRLLDLLRLGAAREDEAEVLPALGQGDELLSHVRGDRDLLDAGHRLRRVLAAHRHEPPGARDRDHHDSSRPSLAVERVDLPAERVAQDQLLERHAGAEPEGTGAEAPDRAGGDLDDPGARVVHAELGVDGPLGKPESARGFSTNGYATSRATRVGSSVRATRRKRGAGTPAALSRRRISSLFLAAEAAATALDRRPRRAAMAAATTVVRSSTATTASIGRRPAKRATVSAAPAGSAKSRVSRLSGARSSSVLGRSEAQIRSTPSLVAASTNACVR